MEVAVHKTVIRQVPVQTAAAHKVVGSRDGNLHRSIQSEKVLHTNETLKSPYLTRFAETGIFDNKNRKREIIGNNHSAIVLPISSPVQQKTDPKEVNLTKPEADITLLEKSSGKGSAKEMPAGSNPSNLKAKKTGKPKVAASIKKPAKKSDKSETRPASIAGKVIKVLSNSKVAKYLIAKGSPILQKGFGALQKLKQNEQNHDDAAEKLIQSEKSVVIPPSEGQSLSNAGQVDQVSSLPAPVPDENKARQQLQQSLAQNIPQTIEDVDNFKQDKKAQGISAAVMTIVQGDKNAVVTTFSEMGNTPAPSPPEQKPEALPAEEIAPSTPVVNLGRDAIAPLQQEHTDVSNYTREADSKLKDEGVTQEQLDMVDSGDLAEANKEKKGLEKAAKSEPSAVRNFALQETGKVEAELKQEENKGRDELKNKRKSNLGNTAQKQKGAKSALEKKRDDVANKINAIFRNAQDKVVKKLDELESQSMKRFDEGNSRASAEFENNVNSELGAFKAVRYDGVRGKLRKAKDWLLGMEDLPEVKAIFDRNRTTFVNTINQLVEAIAADNKKVIKECKDQLANAKKQISEFVAKLGPELKDIGQKAAGEMNTKLAELDNFVNKKEQELQRKLEDKQKSAIKAIDDKIEKMKEDMSGALSKIGKLLLMAAKKFFTWALQKFGYALSEIEGFINKGVSVLKSIFTKPLQFVKNLVFAATSGFKNFGKNFLTHLKDAIFNWLTGALGGIKLPETWDIKGVASVALQVIGISYENIRTHLVKYLPEPVIASLEKGFDLVKTLIAVGPMTAWDQIKEMGTEMRDAFVEAATEWVHNTIVMKAIETIGSLLVPGAGIIRAIVGIYDSVMFFVQKAKDIARMVGNFLSSVGEIAAGNIGAAASALENGLATALSLVIDFLARFLHLSGISEKIKKAIQKIRGKVDAEMDKVARWIADKGKKLVGAAKAGAAKIFEWWKVRSKFKGRDGKQHQMYFTGSGATATLTVATTPMVLEKFLAQLTNVDDDQKASQRIVLENKKIIDDLKEKSKGSFDEKDGEIIKRSLKIIADELPKLGTAKLPPSVINWSKKPFGKNVVGTRMVANPLSIHPGKHAGSQPYEDSDLWKAVNRRSGTYVKGHLLNHHVHGPGNNENLIPITYSLNTTMESRVEDKIKHAVLSENKVIKYEVTMTFGQPVRKHLPAESELPKSIEFSATEMKEQDGKWVETTNKLPVPPSLPHNLPADESVGIVHEEVNLSEASSSQLGEIPGIGPVLATRILEVKEKLGRKFRIYSDLENVKGIGDEKLKYLKEEKWIKLF